MAETTRLRIGGLVCALPRAPVLEPLWERFRHLALTDAAPDLSYALDAGALSFERRVQAGGPVESRGPYEHAHGLRAYLELDLYAQVVALTRASPLHAASLAVAQGEPSRGTPPRQHGVVLAGPSGSGKTSLCLALRAEGAIYLGEEHAFLYEDGSLEGLPRQQYRYHPDGALELVDAQPVGNRVSALTHAFVLSPARGSAPPARLSAAEGAAALLTQLHRPPTAADLARVTRVAGRAQVWSLALEGVEAARDAVLEILRASEAA